MKLQNCINQHDSSCCDKHLAQISCRYFLVQFTITASRLVSSNFIFPDKDEDREQWYTSSKTRRRSAGTNSSVVIRTKWPHFLCFHNWAFHFPMEDRLTQINHNRALANTSSSLSCECFTGNWIINNSERRSALPTCCKCNLHFMSRHSKIKSTHTEVQQTQIYINIDNQKYPYAIHYSIQGVQNSR